VDAYGVAQRRQESSHEKLHSLGLIHPARARKKLLEAIGVLFDGPRAAAFSELKEGRRLEGWSEPQVEEVLEPDPRRRSLILLQLDEP
jgi:hypothetical protein